MLSRLWSIRVLVWHLTQGNSTHIYPRCPAHFFTLFSHVLVEEFSVSTNTLVNGTPRHTRLEKITLYNKLYHYQIHLAAANLLGKEYLLTLKLTSSSLQLEQRPDAC